MGIVNDIFNSGIGLEDSNDRAEVQGAVDSIGTALAMGRLLSVKDVTELLHRDVGNLLSSCCIEVETKDGRIIEIK